MLADDLDISYDSSLRHTYPRAHRGGWEYPSMPRLPPPQPSLQSGQHCCIGSSGRCIWTGGSACPEENAMDELWFTSTHKAYFFLYQDVQTNLFFQLHTGTKFTIEILVTTHLHTHLPPDEGSGRAIIKGTINFRLIWLLVLIVSSWPLAQNFNTVWSAPIGLANSKIIMRELSVSSTLSPPLWRDLDVWWETAEDTVSPHAPALNQAVWNTRSGRSASATPPPHTWLPPWTHLPWCCPMLWGGGRTGKTKIMY